MKEKIKVLIVDDAIVVRILVGNALSKEPDIDFVGKAENGKIALEKIEELKPDVVLLDIEMPEMNGLEVLKVLRDKGMPTKVIMFSTYTTVGAKHTFEALELGAADFVPKPSSSGFSKGFERVHEELLAKIKFIGSGNSRQTAPSLPTAQKSSSVIRSGEYDVVFIEGGMGAPKTFMNIIPQIPAGFPASLLIFQAMFSSFAEQFVRRLEQNARIPIKTAEQDDKLLGGQAYVLIGDQYVAIKRTGADIQFAFRAKEGTEKYGSVPRLLCESLAKFYGKKAIGVLLAGAGEGNLEGIQALKEQGGLVLAEEPTTLVGRQVLNPFVEKKIIDGIVPTQELIAALTKAVGFSG
ncbi:response regulator receiver modulated CheB methylesterase [Candidatus Moduliflexus flocculans]|uniref:protein-glutamate methylesterase n=1 Tax=Candidatus Moduliflexus flocculans TaxID=1499966 RepID=A0A0S6VRB2_9BACT|nr:response regulator receiver modulated CheB methylesterase [Candidatus Moduliflexus flocculans]